MSFEHIASREGGMYTIWGPCFCTSEHPFGMNGVCMSCVNANRIESKGLDWDEEYGKAAKNGFNGVPAS